jgi:hypothetical protein
VINPAVSPPRWKSCGAIVDGSSEMRNAAIMSVPPAARSNRSHCSERRESGAVAIDLRGVERLLGRLRGALHGSCTCWTRDSKRSFWIASAIATNAMRMARPSHRS